MFVKYNRENVMSAFSSKGQEFLFVPGTNEVPREVWDGLMENPNFKGDVNRKPAPGQQPMFEIQSEAEPIEDDNGEVVQPAFARIENKQDKSRIIKETYDVKALKEMRRNETDRAIVEVIDAQIAQINRRRDNPRDRNPGEE